MTRGRAVSPRAGRSSSGTLLHEVAGRSFAAADGDLRAVSVPLDRSALSGRDLLCLLGPAPSSATASPGSCPLVVVAAHRVEAERDVLVREPELRFSGRLAPARGRRFPTRTPRAGEAAVRSAE